MMVRGFGCGNHKDRETGRQGDTEKSVFCRKVKGG